MTSSHLLLFLLLLFLHLFLSSAQCTNNSPSPLLDSTLVFSLIIGNLTVAQLSPDFSVELFADLDADIQASDLAPTASTIPDLQCNTVTSSMDVFNQSAVNVSVIILGTLTVDTGVTPVQFITQLIVDIHAGFLQANSSYDIVPEQHVNVYQLCPDGVTMFPLDDTTDTCPNMSEGGGGLSVGVQAAIAMLVLVVSAFVLGVIAWKYVVAQQKKEEHLGRRPIYG